MRTAGLSIILLFSFAMHSTVYAVAPAISSGQEFEQLFSSPQSVQEACVVLAKIPGGDYSNKDYETEAKYCSVSLYDANLAVCPKTWSTSPGTMLYDLSESEFNRSSYQSSKYCGSKQRGPGVSTFAKFKQSMNASGTSGTFSQSSLLYYHFSRYFDTKVTVPVSVYREMDKNMHLELVSKKGVRKAKGKMNRVAWKKMVNAGQRPSSYSPTSDLFTGDRSKVYGIMVRGKGERYQSEFNGTRVSGWGKGQNRDFQKTPGFLALRDPSDLATAMENGLNKARRDSKMRKDLFGVTDLQMVFWMRELIETTLMDYIFSQQDRVGNIDFRWHWYYVQNGEVKSKREKRSGLKDLSRSRSNRIPVPKELAAFDPVLVQRTHLNDNDAGGLVRYSNFSKSTGMLNGLKHYSAKTYTRLMNLDRDLQAGGAIYQWLEANVDLTPKRLRQVVSNTHKAANILRSQCQGMQFDLDDPDGYLVAGARTESVDCSL